MSLTAAQVADLKDKWQYYTFVIQPFPQITWSVTDLSAFSGAITWKPFCLLSPRFSYINSGSVIIDGSDSFVRPNTAVDTVVFSKASGTGTVTDNGDKTCTVSGVTGVVKVQAVATVAATGQTATAYAYVRGGGTGITLSNPVVENLSGSLATGEWSCDVRLKEAYTTRPDLTDDGRDQPFLMHVEHYYDGVNNTFGGYKRHQNTFIMLCRDSSIRVNHAGDYETILHLESPAYVLKRAYLEGGELQFSETGSGGDLTATNLTPTDVAYFVLREGTNLHQYFNMSIWNNASNIDNFTVRANANFWDIVQDCHGYNFGMTYFNRWSNLDSKPDPRARFNDWDAIEDPVYDSGNALTVAHMLNYDLHRRRVDNVGRVSLQAILPDMTLVDSTSTSGTIGELWTDNSLVVEDDTELDSWAEQMANWLNTEYEIEFRLGMGHELNPGNLFSISGWTPPIGDAVAGESWIVDDINYEFDFRRGFWTRRIRATKINTGGE